MRETLADLPYAGEFDLDREQHKPYKVWQHEQAGGNFVVRKQRINKPVPDRFDHFPTYEEAKDAVEKDPGGGNYGIYADDGLVGLNHQNIPAPSRYLEGKESKTRAGKPD